MRRPEPVSQVTLRRHLFGPFVVVAALFLAATLLGAEHLLQHLLEERSIARGRLAAHSVVNAVGVLAEDAQIARIVSAMAAEPDIASILVVAGQRVIAADTLRLIDTPAAELPVHERATLQRLRGDTAEHCEFDRRHAQVTCAMRVTLAVADAARRHGYVRLVLDYSGQAAMLAEDVHGQVYWTAGLLALLFAVLLLLVQRLVVAPIAALTRATTAPDFADVLRGFTRTRVREIGQLADALATAARAQRASEDSLRLHLERFNLAVDGAAAVIWDVDLESDRAYFSPRLGEFLGLPADAVPRSAAEFSARLHQDDVPKFRHTVLAHVRDRAPYALEFRLRHADGTYRWMASRGQAIWNTAGRATRIAGSLTDISARRAAEAANAALDAKVRRIVNNFAGIVFEYTWTATGEERFESHSPLLHAFFDLPDGVSDVPLATLLRQVHPDDLAAMRASIDRAVRDGEPWRHEFRLRRRDGVPTWIEGRSTPREDAGHRIFTGTLVDITARKEAEREAANRQALIASVVENTGAVSFRCVAGAGWPIVHVSDGIEKLSGYPAAAHTGPDAPSILGFIHPDDLPECLRRVEAALAEQRPWRVEYRMRHRDGSERWVSSQGTVITGLEDNVTHVDGVLFDIHEAKLAELALRESETRLNLVVRGGDLGTWEWDYMHGTFVVNDRWRELHGLSGEASVHEALIWERIHPDDRERVRRAFTAHLWHGVPFYEAEYRIRRDENDWVWALVRGQVVSRDTAGLPRLIAGTHMDVTATKLATARLQESKALLRTVLDLLPQRVYWKDRHGRYLGSNRAFAADHGFDSVVGLTLHDLGYEPAELEQSLESDRRALELGTEVLNVVMQIAGGPRDATWVDHSKVPLRDAHGTIIGVAGTYLDVTAFKRTEHALIAARDAADRANRAKSEFLSTMSHEIRTPLNGVLGCAELLVGPTLNEDQRHLVDMIRTCSKTLLGMLNDILDLSRIEAHQLRVEAIPFAPRDLCADVVDLMAPRAADHRLELTLHWRHDAPATITSDPLRVRQVLSNLVGNALKFTPEGQVLVHASRDPAGALRVEVSDTGIGIAADKHTAIFDAFTQADGSITRDYGGTGLGLTISRRIVEALGGKIGVDSTPGIGSTFWFTLPAPAQASSEVPPASFRDHRVVVLSEHPPRVAALAEDLATLGAKVRIATTPADAGAALTGLEPTVLLFDYGLIEREGPGWLARWRAADPDARLVALCPVDLLAQLDRSQFAAVLTLPVSRLGTLADALAQALETRADALLMV
ncbi:MAG: PAS domain-containing protein [Gammaproteobacteria bacterium]